MSAEITGTCSTSFRGCGNETGPYSDILTGDDIKESKNY